MDISAFLGGVGSYRDTSDLYIIPRLRRYHSEERDDGSKSKSPSYDLFPPAITAGEEPRSQATLCSKHI